MLTTYIKIEGDDVTVTFASDAVLNSTKMTKAELIKYINGEM